MLSVFVWRVLESHLCLSIISQDPSMSTMLESLQNPANKDQLDERMARIKEDPSLKPILEEIESGGPAAMMRSRVICFN